jgi:hypothetical protein
MNKISRTTVGIVAGLTILLIGAAGVLARDNDNRNFDFAGCAVIYVLLSNVLLVYYVNCLRSCDLNDNQCKDKCFRRFMFGYFFITTLLLLCWVRDIFF